MRSSAESNQRFTTLDCFVPSGQKARVPEKIFDSTSHNDFEDDDEYDKVERAAGRRARFTFRTWDTAVETTKYRFYLRKR
jgi:hypothetical protein